MPNLIEWDKGTPHPATTAPTGVELLALRGQHPAPESVTPMLKALGVELEIRNGEMPKLVAIFESPNGPIELS